MLGSRHRGLAGLRSSTDSTGQRFVHPLLRPKYKARWLMIKDEEVKNTHQQTKTSCYARRPSKPDDSRGLTTSSPTPVEIPTFSQRSRSNDVPAPPESYPQTPRSPTSSLGDFPSNSWLERKRRRRKPNVSGVRREHAKSAIFPSSRVFLSRRKRSYPSPEVGLSLWKKRSKKRRGSSSYNFFESQHLLYTQQQRKQGVGVSQVLNSSKLRRKSRTERGTTCRVVWPHKSNETRTCSTSGNGHGRRTRFEKPECCRHCKVTERRPVPPLQTTERKGGWKRVCEFSASNSRDTIEIPFRSGSGHRLPRATRSCMRVDILVPWIQNSLGDI